MVENGYVERYDYSLETLKDAPYDQWREYDPEDTVRFYALRLQEVGMLKSTPQKLIAGDRLALLARAQEGVEGIEGMCCNG